MSSVPFRMSLVRSGGFAGRTVRASLDSETLPPEEARAVAGLVDALDLPALADHADPAEGAGRDGNDRVRDGFSYDLSVERGGQVWQVTVTETQVDPEVRQVLHRLVQHARTGAEPAGPAG